MEVCKDVGMVRKSIQEFVSARDNPVLVDLFSGAGGASSGYAQAGFDVLGIDHKRFKRYPFEQIVFDCFKLDASCFEGVPAIHASPPCQAYSITRFVSRTPMPSFDQIDWLRHLFKETGAYTVIENVPGAPVRNQVELDGSMFPELRVKRRRLFEVNFYCLVPPSRKQPLTHTENKTHPRYGTTNEWDNTITVVGQGGASLAAKQDAMQIDWMSVREISQAIPPAYTKFIGKQMYDSIINVRRVDREESEAARRAIGEAVTNY